MTQRVRADGRSTVGARTGERVRGDLAARRMRLRGVIEPVVIAAGYDLEELTVSRAGRRHMVRVIVDGDAGVSLDAVADVSRAVSRALDEAEETGGDLVAGEYQLEISSPGVDRPLIEARHWRRNVGRLVKVTVKVPGAAPADLPATGGAGVTGQLTGRVLDVDGEWVTLDLEAGPRDATGPGAGRVQPPGCR